MNILYRYIRTSVFVLMLVSCQTTPKIEVQDPFEIRGRAIGLLTDTTKVAELDTIYKDDSIVKRIAGDEFIGSSNEIEVYAKGGKPLVTLEVSENFDPDATVKTVQVISPEFRTNRGMSISDTFGEVKQKHQIAKIDNLLSSVVVHLDTLGIYFSIDKKELPEHFWSDTEAKVKVEDIPEEATIKNMWVTWPEL